MICLFAIENKVAIWYCNMAFGVVAHLGERVVRNDEVAGSIPVSSTKR